VAADAAKTARRTTPEVSSAKTRDWAAETADTIDQLIGKVRSKTTTPIERLTRVVVYGLICGILGFVAITLLVIAAVRALDEAIPGEVWPAHLLIGGIFLAGGLLLWRKRSVEPSA
jgi:hypothetical protein